MKINSKMKFVAIALAGVVCSGLATAAPAMAAYKMTNKGNCYDETKTLASGETFETKSYSTLTECNAAVAGQGSGHTDNLMGSLQGVLNAVFAVIGFIAVVMIVYGGIQYTISSGDAGKVKKAKDTILYGIVGLIIALLAAAIVNFVLVNALK